MAYAGGLQSSFYSDAERAALAGGNMPGARPLAASAPQQMNSFAFGTPSGAPMVDRQNLGSAHGGAIPRMSMEEPLPQSAPPGSIAFPSLLQESDPALWNLLKDSASPLAGGESSVPFSELTKGYQTLGRPFDNFSPLSSLLEIGGWLAGTGGLSAAFGGGGGGAGGFLSDLLSGASNLFGGGGSDYLSSAGSFLSNIFGGGVEAAPVTDFEGLGFGSGEAGQAATSAGAIGPPSIYGGEEGSVVDRLKRLMSGGNARSLAQGYSGAKSLSDIVSGIYGLNQSKKIGALAAPGQAASQRMQQLTADPSQITNTPGYQELLKQRETALSRRMAAQGYNLSGNEKASLAELGGAQFSDYYAQEMDRLSKQVNSSYAPAVGEQQMRANAINRLVYGGARALGG